MTTTNAGASPVSKGLAGLREQIVRLAQEGDFIAVGPSRPWLS